MLATSYCPDNNTNNNNPLLYQQLQLLQRQQEQQQRLLQQQQQQQQSFPTVATEDFPYFTSPPSSTPASPPLSPPDFSTSSSVTAGSVDLSAYLDNNGHPSMPSATVTSAAGTSQTPPIRVHQSSPPFGGQYWDQGLQSSMLSSQPHGLPTENSNWKSDAAAAQPSARLLSPAKFHRRAAPYNHHKRASSNSSGASAPSDSISPLGHANSAAPSGYSQTSSSFSPSAFNSYNTPQQSNVSKALPTPEHTPVQNNFLVTQFPNYDHPAQDGDQGEADFAMRRAILEQQQQQQQEEDSSFPYSLAPSVSTLSHNSPVTPQTAYAEDFDDSSKTIPHDFNNQTGNNQLHIPKLNRTMSDIYQDELYNPPMVSPTSHVRNQSNVNLNMSRNLFADRLQAARQGHISARSQSPTTMNREQSPFRQGSPFAQSTSNYSGAHMQQPSQLASEMQMGGQGDAMGLVQQQENRTEPKTISPKDALLEYNESIEDGEDIPGPDMPLFQSTQGGSNEHMDMGGNTASNFQPTPNVTSIGTFPNHYAQHQALLAQQYPFMPQQHQQQHQPQPQHQQPQGNMVHPTMEFPSAANSETTMNTTSSTPSQRQMTISTPNNHIKRPEDTTADSGTYTCTYHGCTHRFETPAKLQKHKREAHRQTTPGSQPPSQVNPRESPSSDIAMRNSQAGPHRCDRINPSTGKPCNSIFSRPYDLTRHEDTIHNARKQKVRCHLCTEEKTFSRNDALTRHMRVVHPEVDWPGKQKRKGRD